MEIQRVNVLAALQYNCTPRYSYGLPALRHDPMAAADIVFKPVFLCPR